jgi:hypothetical protein
MFKIDNYYRKYHSMLCGSHVAPSAGTSYRYSTGPYRYLFTLAREETRIELSTVPMLHCYLLQRTQDSRASPALLAVCHDDDDGEPKMESGWLAGGTATSRACCKVRRGYEMWHLFGSIFHPRCRIRNVCWR